MKHIGLFSALIISGFLGGGGMVLADTDPALPCYATVDEDLNVTIPCVEVDGGFHSAVLERIQNPTIDGKLEWQLKTFTPDGGVVLNQSSSVIGYWRHITSQPTIPTQVTGPTMLFNGDTTAAGILNGLACPGANSAHSYFLNTVGEVYIVVGGGIGDSGWDQDAIYEEIGIIVDAVTKGTYVNSISYYCDHIETGWTADISMVTGINTTDKKSRGCQKRKKQQRNYFKDAGHCVF